MQVTTDRNKCMFCGGKALRKDDYYICDDCKMTWVDREVNDKTNS